MLRRLIRKVFGKAAADNSEAKGESAERKGWIGVDLDGTLARYDGWYGPAHIGEPIQPMIVRVRNWLDNGVEVRIFTARASVPEYIPFVEKWLQQQGLPPLKITNRKDFGMISLWDDRCVEVISNEGVPRVKGAF